MLLGVYPGVKSLDLYGNSIFNSFKNSQMVLKVAVPLHISTSKVWGFPFLHTFTNIGVCALTIILAILVGVKWYLIVILICISPIANAVDPLFMILLAIGIYVFEEVFVQSFAHFLIGLFPFCYWDVRVLYPV